MQEQEWEKKLDRIDTIALIAYVLILIIFIGFIVWFLHSEYYPKW